jgi:hypothetical protein
METAAPAVRTEEKARTRYIDGEVTNVPVTNDPGLFVISARRHSERAVMRFFTN